MNEESKVDENVKENSEGVNIIKSKTVNKIKSDEYLCQRKHKHKRKRKRHHENEKRNDRIKRQKTDTENKENDNTDTSEDKYCKRKSKSEYEVSDNNIMKECFVSVKKISDNKTPSLEENRDSFPGELPLMTDILTKELELVNRKLEINQMELNQTKPKKINFNEYMKKKEEHVMKTNSETVKKENGKLVNLIRGDNGIWRRHAIPADKQLIATKLNIDLNKEKEDKITRDIDNENVHINSVPNRCELSMGLFQSELFYDPEGKVEINEDLLREDKSEEIKADLRSSREDTPLMDELDDCLEKVENRCDIQIETEKYEQNKNETMDIKESKIKIPITDKHETMNIKESKIKIPITDKHETMNEKGSKIKTQIAKEVLTEKDREMQKIAIDLLTTGVMPICPPGRRDWGQNTQYNLPEINFSWPPLNWQKMTPDRKLFAWEYAAMTLEKETEGSVDPEMSRAYLLDKFNYLALPGSAKHVKEREEIGASRTRFYCYQTVREIACGKQVTTALENHIKFLRDIRKTSEDFKLKLRSIDAPLRLNAAD
jgi:hypothetical protein